MDFIIMIGYFNKILNRALSTILVLSIVLFSHNICAQNKKYAKELIKVLASEDMAGRGYINDGDAKAAEYLISEFEKHNIEKFKSGLFSKSYSQKYNFPINTIPNVNYFVYGSDTLEAGVDYLIGSASKTTNASFKLVVLLGEDLKDEEKVNKIKNLNLSNTYIVTDGDGQALIYNNVFNSAGIIFLTDNLLWSVSGANTVKNYGVIYLQSNLFNDTTTKVSISFDNEFVKKHKTQNIVGFVKGEKYPDSFIVFTAHYDHIGMMEQDVIFPGANDNASGTAMVMDLARHYSESNPDYSIAFILFSGEEAGLYGSKFYTENPLFSLAKIKFLINLDMVGTGSDGITLVNGGKFPAFMEIVNQINDEKKYLTKVKARGESCNSDHCFFYQKGVKAFFIYSMGKEHLHYHNINDKADALPLTKYEEIFKLLIDTVLKLEEV